MILGHKLHKQAQSLIVRVQLSPGMEITWGFSEYLEAVDDTGEPRVANLQLCWEGLLHCLSVRPLQQVILSSIASERSGWSNYITWPDVVKKVVER